MRINRFMGVSSDEVIIQNNYLDTFFKRISDGYIHSLLEHIESNYVESRSA